jgi:hypothetical protein
VAERAGRPSCPLAEPRSSAWAAPDHASGPFGLGFLDFAWALSTRSVGLLSTPVGRSVGCRHNHLTWVDVGIGRAFPSLLIPICHIVVPSTSLERSALPPSPRAPGVPKCSSGPVDSGRGEPEAEASDASGSLGGLPTVEPQARRPVRAGVGRPGHVLGHWCRLGPRPCRQPARAACRGRRGHLRLFRVHAPVDQAQHRAQ